jgi:hypothetical protein
LEKALGRARICAGQDSNDIEMGLFKIGMRPDQSWSDDLRTSSGRSSADVRGPIANIMMLITNHMHINPHGKAEQHTQLCERLQHLLNAE